MVLQSRSNLCDQVLEVILNREIQNWVVILISPVSIYRECSQRLFWWYSFAQKRWLCTVMGYKCVKRLSDRVCFVVAESGPDTFARVAVERVQSKRSFDWPLCVSSWNGGKVLHGWRDGGKGWGGWGRTGNKETGWSPMTHHNKRWVVTRSCDVALSLGSDLLSSCLPLLNVTYHKWHYVPHSPYLYLSHLTLLTCFNCLIV